MQQGWDPEVKIFFRKILSCFMYGLLWLMTGVAAGIYYELAIPGGKPLWYNLTFYTVMFVSLFFLLRYYYKTWKKN